MNPIQHSLFRVNFLLGFFFAICASSLAGEDEERFRVLVFSKTEGFRHSSIEPGTAAIKKLGEEHGFGVKATEDPAVFNAENLRGVQAVIFLNTTGPILDEEQRKAFEKYVEAGGGFVGIHSAADTGYEWEWYGSLVGAYFESHPRIQEAVIRVEDDSHISTSHLPSEWVRADEWYSFRANPREEVHVLMSLDTSSFDGSSMGDDHPIAWLHRPGAGRAYYTGLGHTEESYAEEAFLEHLLGAIRWAAGQVKTEKGEAAPKVEL